MKKKILYIILAFFCMGCDMSAGEQPVTTSFPQPEPVVVTKAPKEIEPLVSVPVITPSQSTTQPTTQPKEVITDVEVNEIKTYEAEVETPDEDEQIKQILVQKIRKAYNENRSNIVTFVVKWICIFFGFVIVLYWLIRLLNLFSHHRLGFTLIWSALFLLAIIFALTVL